MELLYEKDKKKEPEKKDEAVEKDADKLKQNMDANKNEYNNYNLAEGNENAVNEKLEGSDNSRLERAYQKNIEFDMSTSKKKLSMKLEEKYDMEKMRRWQVKIYNIYVTSLMQQCDPFLQFTIGGNFNVSVYKTKKGDIYKVPKGVRGYADKTEVAENVELLERRPYEKIIDIEMRMTYSMVASQKMMVEIWDYNTFFMNEIKGYITTDLIDIVNGDCNISLDIKQKVEGKKNSIPYARIDFKCIFQEIWDFKLNFLNWKAGCILPPKKSKNDVVKEKYPSTQMKIELAQKACGDRYSESLSEEAKNTDTPMWSNFVGLILYRGTVSMLENESLKLTLYNTSGIFDVIISEKIVQLTGVLDFERLKTEFTLVDNSTTDKYNVAIEGMVNIDNRPRYKQTGENVVLMSNRKYLCINIMRVENIRPAETRGIVDSFVSVEWCGVVQRSRTVKENNSPSFNEILYFQVPLPEEYILNPEKHAQKINEEFLSKNEVMFNLMIEGDDNTYDNLGISFFHLSDLKDGAFNEKKYFADDVKREKKYVSRIFTNKSKLVSAFSESNNTYVHYEAWFLEDFPSIIDFGEKKKKSELVDKIPMDLKPYLDKGQDPFIDRLKREIPNKFSKYTNYSYRERLFYDVKPMDQFRKNHLLPYFLSPLTTPEKIYSIDDMTKNPNFFDCNLNSLDEVAHYARCFPYPREAKSEVWSSPDFTLKIRKGGIEDHSILMACLMMGLKRSKSSIKYYEIAADLSGENETTKGNSTTTGGGTRGGTTRGGTTRGGTTDGETPQKDIIITRMNEKVVFPYENRVFVCLGKLKYTRAPHIWVMTIGDDYRDITFWEPKLLQKFDLTGRVDDYDKLRNFLNFNYPDYDAVRKGKVITKVEEESDDDESIDLGKKKLDMEEIRLRGLNEDSILEYKENDDIYKDFQMNESGHLLGEIGDVGIKFKNIIPHQIDDKLTYDKEDKTTPYSFMAEQNKTIDEQMKQGNEVNFLPVDVFKDRSGKIIEDKQNLPYETIDCIFNRNNIYMNLQYHDPSQIKYNLYDNECWMPYIGLKSNQIWRGKFEPFYSLSNFGPVYSPGLVNKMKESLIKEVRVGITAARSGMNLQTRFKKKVNFYILKNIRTNILMEFYRNIATLLRIER